MQLYCYFNIFYQSGLAIFVGFCFVLVFINCYVILGNKIQIEKAKTHKLLLKNEENKNCKQ